VGQQRSKRDELRVDDNRRVLMLLKEEQLPATVGCSMSLLGTARPCAQCNGWRQIVAALAHAGSSSG
jgi:hypothetical protein